MLGQTKTEYLYCIIGKCKNITSVIIFDVFFCVKFLKYNREKTGTNFIRKVNTSLTRRGGLVCLLLKEPCPRRIISRKFCGQLSAKPYICRKRAMPMYIHEHKEWPFFSWDKELVGKRLNKVHKAVGYLMGRLSVIGFNDKMSAVVESISHDIIASSEIEGVELNNG